ncbi:MAG TPA: PH domain-containing protein [Planctomycetota bacterium]|nr:PH domain-containing protein [Planctomycetota bacterium]
MKCVPCAADLPAGSLFCPKCGAKQGAGAAAANPGTEPEQPIWEDRYSFLADAHLWILWSLFAGAALFAALKWLHLDKPWMRWVYAGAVLLPALWLLLSDFISRISVRYRLTTHRLFKEEGILSRRISEIELMRIDDLSVSQNLVQRIFDIGVVTLMTTDTSDPRLEIRGIRHPVQVKEHIRAQVQRRRARTLNVESL